VEGFSVMKKQIKSDKLRVNRKKPTERNLRALETKIQVLLDSIQEGYAEVDLKGTTLLCNKSFSHMVGYTVDELIGMNYVQYVSGEESRRVFTSYNKVFKTGVPNKGFCYEIIKKDGTKRVIENSISLMRDSKGHRKGFRSVVRDITDRILFERELEIQRSHMKAIFESVKDAILLLEDSKMKVIEANASSENICGLVPQENLGKVFTDCTTRCGKNCIHVIEGILMDTTIDNEFQIKCNRYDRPQQRVIITGSKSHIHGQFTETVIVIKDITRLSSLEQGLRERQHFQKLLGKSNKMQDIYEYLNSLADLDTIVLVTGKSGTGKSLIAQSLHYSGNRAQKPIIVVNCSALPESLLESELFGHVKGSFTGAIRDTVGRFELASGGTIVLDEIGDISPRIQLKLLKILEEKEFEKVGDSVPIKTNARVIACTNQDLKEKVRLGEFREDLYYRLKVFEVKVPSLEDRMEDIPLLVEHFLNFFNAKFSKNIRKLSHEVMEIFMRYTWPGNIRELKHCIEHAFILCRGPILCLEHLPAEIRLQHESKQRVEKRNTTEERGRILMVLKETYWNKAVAARLLGIDRSTLYRKIYKYQLSESQVLHATKA
jgi:PAS domain S-box-containing protein